MTFTAVLPLVVVLVLLTPWKAAAGPSEGVSGEMAFDEVGHWVKLYQRTTDKAKRTRLLEHLARSRDPRVEPIFMEVMTSEPDDYYRNTWQCLFGLHYLRAKPSDDARFGKQPPRADGMPRYQLRAAREWIEQKEIAALRREKEELEKRGRR